MKHNKHNIHTLEVGNCRVHCFGFSSAKDAAGWIEKHIESIITNGHYETAIEIRVEVAAEQATSWWRKSSSEGRRSMTAKARPAKTKPPYQPRTDLAGTDRSVKQISMWPPRRLRGNTIALAAARGKS
jgi:hypothetical protein